MAAAHRRQGTPGAAREAGQGPEDPLKLVIVRDMWLTGFDAPSMHTMYIDKPMRGHGLMQAIARVNRVFCDKPAGLIVRLHRNRSEPEVGAWPVFARRPKARGDRQGRGHRSELEKYEVVSDMFHGFDYRAGLTGSPQERLVALAGAIEWILEMQQRDAARESTKEGKKRAHRRFNDAVLELSKGFALAGASDQARDIRDEVGFFQTVRAGACQERARLGQIIGRARLGRTADREPRRRLDRNHRHPQSRRSGDADISILSGRVPRRVEGMEKKNLAMEALRKLINGEIRSRSRVNVVQTRAFSERLAETMPATTPMPSRRRRSFRN